MENLYKCVCVCEDKGGCLPCSEGRHDIQKVSIASSIHLSVPEQEPPCPICGSAEKPHAVGISCNFSVPQVKAEDSRAQLTKIAEWLRKWEIVDGSGENIALHIAIDQLFDAQENGEIIALLAAHVQVGSKEREPWKRQESCSECDGDGCAKCLQERVTELEREVSASEALRSVWIDRAYQAESHIIAAARRRGIEDAAKIVELYQCSEIQSAKDVRPLTRMIASAIRALKEKP